MQAKERKLQGYNREAVPGRAKRLRDRLEVKISNIRQRWQQRISSARQR
jgi:hypothetical protein